VPAGSETRAEALRQRVERLLEARVGTGNAVVEVSVDTVTETETILERRVDPDSRVAISTDSEERSETARGTAGGQVTVASNLPDGDAADADQSSSQNSETRERVNYEVSETQREITRAPGAIRRITVAVLVNGTTQTDASGTPVFMPRPEEELSALRDLVASAVGFDEARGDVITLRSLAFEPAEPPGTEAIAPAWSWPALDVMSLIQAAVLGLVSLLLGLFVLRPILRQPPQDLPALAPAAAPASVPATAHAPGPALTGEIDDGTADPDSMSVVGSDRATAPGALSARGEDDPDPVTRLRALIADRQEETVEILRSWLDDRERAE